MSRISCFSRAARFSLLAIGILFHSASFAVNFDHTQDFDYSKLTEGQELGCLAMNIYHEGRGESAKGRAAIAAVTMNRVASPHYPDSICEVVWQRKQFSWTRIAARHHVIKDQRSWVEALTIASLFVEGAMISKIGNATHYHADHVEPYWSETQTLIGKVGGHYFYTL